MLDSGSAIVCRIGSAMSSGDCSFASREASVASNLGGILNDWGGWNGRTCISCLYDFLASSRLASSIQVLRFPLKMHMFLS